MSRLNSYRYNSTVIDIDLRYRAKQTEIGKSEQEIDWYWSKSLERLQTRCRVIRSLFNLKQFEASKLILDLDHSPSLFGYFSLTAIVRVIIVHCLEGFPFIGRHNCHNSECLIFCFHLKFNRSISITIWSTLLDDLLGISTTSYWCRYADQMTSLLLNLLLRNVV